MGPSSEPLISLQNAWERIAREVRPGPIEQVPVSEAHERVLAEQVVATADYPAFDKSMMDGYAVRSESTAGAPCTLHMVGELPAGRFSHTALGAGDAMRINTGAPLPPGADAVVPVEETESTGNGGVRINRPAPAGRCVSRRGSIRRAGQVVLSAPARIRSAQLAGLATAGVAAMKAYRRPTVAIVVTGDELVAIGSTPAEGRIIDSNGPMLAAMARECGADVVRSSVARDDERDLASKLSDALGAVGGGVVVAVGGMSKGTRDLVPGVATKLGVRWVFHGVSVRPGKPAGFGIGPAGQIVFGLPGNPVSSAVCFLAFVRLALDRLSGFPRSEPTLLRARLAEPIPPGRDPRPAFLPAHVSLGAGEAVAQICQWSGSSDPFGPAAANAYVFQSDGMQPFDAGEWVGVLPMPGLSDDPLAQNPGTHN